MGRSKYSSRQHKFKLIARKIKEIIKFLGWWFSSNMSMNHHMIQIRGIVFKDLTDVWPVLPHLPLKLRRYTVYSKAVSNGSHRLVLYAGLSELINDRLTAILV